MRSMLPDRDVPDDSHPYGAREYPGAAALAAQFGFDRVLCVCDADNAASETVILKNGGVLEDERYDPEEAVTVRRY